MSGQLVLFDGVQLANWTKTQLVAVSLPCPEDGEPQGITAMNGQNLTWPSVAVSIGAAFYHGTGPASLK